MQARIWHASHRQTEERSLDPAVARERNIVGAEPPLVVPSCPRRVVVQGRVAEAVARLRAYPLGVEDAAAHNPDVCRRLRNDDLVALAGGRREK